MRRGFPRRIIETASELFELLQLARGRRRRQRLQSRLEGVKIPRVPAQPRERCRRDPIDYGLDSRNSILCPRVRPEPSLYAARAACTFGDQLLEPRHEALGTDSRAHDIVDCLVVGFKLVLPAESSEHGAPREAARSAGDLTVADAGEEASKS